MNTTSPARLEAEQRVLCELGWAQSVQPHPISRISTSPLWLTHPICIIWFLSQKKYGYLANLGILMQSLI